LKADSALIERARAAVGRPIWPDRVARDAIDPATIRRWCDAMRETNPRFARGVAPPAMLAVWTMPHFDPQYAREPMELLQEFDGAGFDGVAATDLEQDFERELRVGDRLTESVQLTAVSDLKQTALGEGVFFTIEHAFSAASGDKVASMRLRLLKFRRAAPRAAHAPPVNAQPDSSDFAEECLPVTASLIVASAIAAGDFERVHHDRAYVQSLGLPDIYMAIHATNGLLQGYAGRCVAGGCVLKSIRLRLGMPCHPGDTLRWSARRLPPARPAAERLRVRGVTARGVHADAELEHVAD